MTTHSKSPQVGDMYRCRSCKLEIHVTSGCDCQDCSADFQCCGEPLEKVTAPAVQND